MVINFQFKLKIVNNVEMIFVRKYFFTLVKDF